MTKKVLTVEYERPLLSQFKAKCEERGEKFTPVLNEILEQFLNHVEGFEQSKSEYTRFTAHYDYDQYESIKGFCKQNDFRLKSIFNTILREYMSRPEISEPMPEPSLDDDASFTGAPIHELTPEDFANAIGKELVEEDDCIDVDGVIED